MKKGFFTPEEVKHLKQIRRKTLMFHFKESTDRLLKATNRALPWLILAYLILN